MSRLLRSAAVFTAAVLAGVAAGCSGDALTAPEGVPDAQLTHTPVRRCAVQHPVKPIIRLLPGQACPLPAHEDP